MIISRFLPLLPVPRLCLFHDLFGGVFQASHPAWHSCHTVGKLHAHWPPLPDLLLTLLLPACYLLPIRLLEWRTCTERQSTNAGSTARSRTLISATLLQTRWVKTWLKQRSPLRRETAAVHTCACRCTCHQSCSQHVVFRRFSAIWALPRHRYRLLLHLGRNPVRLVDATSGFYDSVRPCALITFMISADAKQAPSACH